KTRMYRVGSEATLPVDERSHEPTRRGTITQTARDLGVTEQPHGGDQITYLGVSLGEVSDRDATNSLDERDRRGVPDWLGDGRGHTCCAPWRNKSHNATKANRAAARELTWERTAS